MIGDERKPYQVMPDLSEERYEELKADIEANGVLVPIEYDEKGNLLDGHHRKRICDELGIKDFPSVVRYGMTEHEKIQHARRLNLNRRHISRAMEAKLRTDMITDALKHDPNVSDRQIASSIGCSPTTVGKHRKRLEESGELSTVDSSIGADGKTRPRSRRNHFDWLPLVDSEGIPGVLEMVPEFLPGETYLGLPRGNCLAKLIEVGECRTDPDFVFVEVSTLFGEGGHVAFTKRAIEKSFVPIHLSMVPELMGVDSIKWVHEPAEPGELGRPKSPSYSRRYDEKWLLEIESK